MMTELTDTELDAVSGGTLGCRLAWLPPPSGRLRQLDSSSVRETAPNHGFPRTLFGQGNG